jgi:hypothetical protein
MKKLSVFLLAFIIGCGQQTEIADYGHPQKAEIKKAIVEMLTQSTDPFLIVENPITQDFIQFYNDEGRILLDIPEVALTPAEIMKAQDYFAQCGIKLETTESKDPGTGETYIINSWTDTFPSEDIDRALNIALGALSEIYGISESTQLTCRKGWE